MRTRRRALLCATLKWFGLVGVALALVGVAMWLIDVHKYHLGFWPSRGKITDYRHGNGTKVVLFYTKFFQ